jgi:hypothetical protein
MTDKFTCTKARAAFLLVAAGTALVMSPATFGQATSKGSGISLDFRRGLEPTALVTQTRQAMQGQGGIAGPASDCCVAHSTPGCDDPECEALICGADPFCCNTQWDGICAGNAQAQCAVCAGGGGSDCCTPHATPGCDDPECEALICGADPFCCNTQWDGICAGNAQAQCAVCAGGGTCPPSANDCCAPSPDGTPGCNDPACCDLICAADPFCCDTAWDGLCSGAALTQCPQCAGLGCPKGGTPPPNDECENATDGGVLTFGVPVVFTGNNECATPDCALFSIGQGNVWLRFEITAASNIHLAYCGSEGVWQNAWLNFAIGCPCTGFSSAASFAFSCPDGNVEMDWQNLPAGVYYYPVMLDAPLGSVGDYVVTITATEGVPVCPNPKHDCFTTGGPGCSDTECCELVCAADPFCCDTAWDGLCVNGAIGLCGLEPPANDNCADRIAVGEVCQLAFNTLGATTDGPPHVACEDGFADQQVSQDIWYNYTPSCDGDVTVSLCGSSYDTKLAVYDGCSCDVSDANLIDCEDDTCGLQSEITFAAKAGNCYKIRVGGFGAAAGSGQLTISNSGAPCTSGCVSDVDNNGTTNVDDLLIIINGWGPCPQ